MREGADNALSHCPPTTASGCSRSAYSRLTVPIRMQRHGATGTRLQSLPPGGVRTSSPSAASKSTLAKVLVYDDVWVTTSFNWLSFKGDLDRTYRMEEGSLVRNRQITSASTPAASSSLANNADSRVLRQGLLVVSSVPRPAVVRARRDALGVRAGAVGRPGSARYGARSCGDRAARRTTGERGGHGGGTGQRRRGRARRRTRDTEGSGKPGPADGQPAASTGGAGTVAEQRKLAEDGERPGCASAEA
ncbi:hypothetical protein SGLAM104S_02582 [Streptomyces glaucescens]